MKIEGLKINYDFFNSPQEFASYMRKPNYYKVSSSSRMKEEDFEYLVRGEKRKIDTLKGSINILNTSGTVYKKTYNVSGGRIDMSRAITGHPKSMIRVERRNGKAKELTLVVGISVPFYVTEEQIEEADRKILAVLQKLSYEGYRIAIYCSFNSYDYGKDVNVCTVKLKEMGEPFELTKIAYPLGNARMLRKCFFNWTYKEKEIKQMKELGVPLFSNFEKEDINQIYTSILGRKTKFIDTRECLTIPEQEVLELIIKED